MTGAKFDIEKFDGIGDFGLWRIKMRALLIQYGCEAALEVLPADMEAEAKAELNKKAHSAVILCLGNKVLREVTGEKTAAVVWSKLETLYMKKSLANKLYLKKKLYTFYIPCGQKITKHIDEFNKIVLDLANIETMREFHTCKQEEGQSVSSYVLKMKSYIDQLERLGHPVTLNLGVSLILVGLSKEYDSFVQNYNMHSMGKTVNELHAMLKLHEETERQGYGNGHMMMLSHLLPNLRIIHHPKGYPAKDAICHHCGEVGHWRRNCPTYLTELLKKKQLSQGASTSGPAGNAIPRDGVYEIEMSCSNTNDSSMYAVSNKRAKLNLDSSLLWHCRLGHISKKRIEKLQHDGLLNSTDIESLGNRYGYVYLLKHKHEVFETFKVFQKEVENQLGKTIKSLRSDRGGEYMSQEFLDHLKEHGIIAHRTPPYTPQHNGVSERRNRTLLDMVRSMMSQTTLPKSFWDYALEYAARIFNMVPTKKVDKTPYEIWHGQAPKLYLHRIPKGKTMGYSFYNPSENKVFVARNAELFKSNLIDQEASGSLEDPEIIQEEDTNPSLDTSLDHE
ncbi:retrotransposon protein, putative, ty1-copia subclass [Tanacetum coccineum]